MKCLMRVLCALALMIFLSGVVEAGGCRAVGQISFNAGYAQQSFVPVQQFQQSYSVQSFAAPVYSMQQFAPVYQQPFFAPGVGYGASLNFNIGKQRFFNPGFRSRSFRFRGRF